MKSASTTESLNLYEQSSQLRSIARMFRGNGDTERPDITFSAVEADGIASLLVAIADGIDQYRDEAG
ncbi:MAG: hypothetical protein A4E66_00825 [Syntrophus sp. PtaB.Bin001]|nr:MAG: hypothetical protein A4E66_00825 [Syntrophus sp. PtaB.Bin001]